MNDGNDAPIYRGKTTSQGTSTGKATINGQQVQLHIGDTVLYLGTTLNTIWENAMLIRWTANG